MNEVIIPQVGQFIRKKNFTPFRSKPCIEVKNINKTKSNAFRGENGTYVVNSIYFITLESIEVVSQETAELINQLWDSLDISAQLEPGLNSTCIREDNGQPKARFEGTTWKKPLFTAIMKNPGVSYQAYKCSTCGFIHIGKVKPQETSDNLAS